MLKFSARGRALGSRARRGDPSPEQFSCGGGAGLLRKCPLALAAPKPAAGLLCRLHQAAASLAAKQGSEQRHSHSYRPLVCSARRPPLPASSGGQQTGPPAPHRASVSGEQSPWPWVGAEMGAQGLQRGRGLEHREMRRRSRTGRLPPARRAPHRPCSASLPVEVDRLSIVRPSSVVLTHAGSAAARPALGASRAAVCGERSDVDHSAPQRRRQLCHTTCVDTCLLPAVSRIMARYLR